MTAFWIAIAVCVALVFLLTWIGAAWANRRRRPDYVDPEDRPLFGDDGHL